MAKSKKLTDKQFLFVENYLLDPNAVKAALAAGFAESTAKKKAALWVGDSRSKCPANMRHVWDAYNEAKEKRSEDTGIDAQWVLKRAALLADFNIRKFLKVDDIGNAVYNFKDATDDDWYCISEYTVDNVFKGSGEDVYEVERIKLKAFDKLKALDLVGRHVKVKAFEKTDIMVGLTVNLSDKDSKA